MSAFKLLKCCFGASSHQAQPVPANTTAPQPAETCRSTPPGCDEQTRHAAGCVDSVLATSAGWEASADVNTVQTTLPTNVDSVALDIEPPTTMFQASSPQLAVHTEPLMLSNSVMKSLTSSQVQFALPSEPSITQQQRDSARQSGSFDGISTPQAAPRRPQGCSLEISRSPRSSGVSNQMASRQCSSSLLALCMAGRMRPQSSPLHRSKTTHSRLTTLITEASSHSGNLPAVGGGMRRSEPAHGYGRSMSGRSMNGRAMSGLEAASTFLRYAAAGATVDGNSASFLQQDKQARLKCLLGSGNDGSDDTLIGTKPGQAPVPVMAAGMMQRCPPNRSRSTVQTTDKPMYQPYATPRSVRKLSASMLSHSSSTVSPQSTDVGSTAGTFKAPMGGQYTVQRRHVAQRPRSNSTPLLQDTRLARLIEAGNQRYHMSRAEAGAAAYLAKGYLK